MPKQPMPLNRSENPYQQQDREESTSRPELEMLELLNTAGLNPRQQRAQREEFKHRLFDLATHYMDQSMKIMKRWIKEDNPAEQKPR